MNIVLLALALQAAQQQQPPGAAASDSDIVVLAHRLKKVRWEYQAKQGKLQTCEIKRSSGSPLVDSLVCKASAQCAAEQPADSDIRLIPCIRARVTRLYAAR